jgi:transposase-like protein
LCERVDQGRPISHVAAEAGVARQTLGKWHARWIVEGEDGLIDRSSRPVSSPNQTPMGIEDRVEALRRDNKVGPLQLMGLLRAEANPPLPRRPTARSSAITGPWHESGPTDRASMNNDHRRAGLDAFLVRYNYYRPHRVLGGNPPISRCPHVNDSWL